MYRNIDFNKTNLNDLSIVFHGIDENFTNKLHRPHEWIFIKLFYLSLLKDRSLANKFVCFVGQFYDNYRFRKLDFNFFDGVALESYCADAAFTLFYTYEEKVDLRPAFIFGDIVTDFLIRCCDFSLVGISNKKIIVTSRLDCNKKFEQYLLEGYSIERKHRLVFVDLTEKFKDYCQFPVGYFGALPILPTKDVGVPVDEMIETSWNSYVKVK